MIIDKDRYYSISEVRKHPFFSRLGRTWIWRAIQAGKLPAKNISLGKRPRLLIHGSDILKIINKD